MLAIDWEVGAGGDRRIPEEARVEKKEMSWGYCSNLGKR